VISVVQRRRRWTTKQDLALMEEAIRPGAPVAACAAAMTAVVTGRISTRTPRSRSSQYG